GRNSLFLAARGWNVDAIDIANEGLDRARATAEERGLDVQWIEADLDADRGDPLERALPDGSGKVYDLIVLVRYVNLPLLDHLVGRLAPGGVLLCEQHLESTADVVGPRSAAFRLKSGELLENVKRLAAREPLRVLDYREGPVQDPDGRQAALVQLLLRRDPSGV